MTRTFSNEVALRVADVTALPRRLFRLHLDSGLLCYTDHTSDIIFQGVTYHSRRISHGPIKTYMGKQADSCTVTLDDVDGQVTGYAVSEDFEGRKLEIWQVFLSPSLGVIDGLAVTPTFSRASVAYNPDTGQQVASGVPRYVTGADGTADGAILIEEGTTNLLTANKASVETDLTGITAAGGAGATLTRDAAFGRHGSASAKLVTNGNGNQGITLSNTAITGGQTYTGSAWIYSEAGGISIKIELYDGFTWTSSTFSLSAGWNLIYHTKTANAAAANISINIFVTNTTTTFWYDCGQLEQKAYATSWQNPADGARANEPLTVPAAGVISPIAGAWSQQVYINSTSKRRVTGQYNKVFYIPGLTSGYMLLDHRPDGPNWRFRIENSLGGSESNVPDSYTPDGWHNFLVTWSVAAAYLYVDGVLRATINTPYMPSAFAASAYIGSSGSGGDLNTYHDDIAFFNRALTAAEVAAMYALGAPSQETPNTTALIKFNGSLTSDDKIVQFKGKMDMPTD